MLVGVDIGGTFTDLIVSDGDALQIHKLLSTPAAPAQAMLAGLAAVGAQAGARIAHGSTVATNAILERKGARTALLTTAGFRDVLAIGRQARPVLYALQPQLPPPLIPRQWCFDVPERLDHVGNVLVPLDLAALDVVLDAVVAQAIDSIAVCFLYSFVNPAHELATRARILERGIFAEEQISLSCEILPEFREYERASTVALNAYVRPVMSRYLGQVEAELPQALAPATDATTTKTTLLIMKSDGGLISPAVARQQAIQTALSGPAAGVIGAFRLAQQAGFDHIITLDIGGTSTDVALCPGTPVYRTETEIDGLPLRVPVIDIATVGAGGGSLARLDAGGALRVGPASAGASPGPIVYGRGGTVLTVTDANAILGRIDPDHFLGGTMALHLEPTQHAITELAAHMGTDAMAAAQGIVAIANTNIVRAIRSVSVERGYDPAAFTLMAFGGAGPLHACAVAAQLGMPRVLIPLYPGVLCAYGLLTANIARTYGRTMLQDATPAALIALRDQVATLRATAHADLEAEGIAATQITTVSLVDLRYRGQSYELTVPFDEEAIARFHAAHAQRYGYALPERPVEVVTLRLQATGTTAKPALVAAPVVAHTAIPNGEKSIEDDGTPTTIKLFDRATLTPGAHLSGPALVFQLDSTIFVAADWSCVVDGYRNMILEPTNHNQ